MGRTMNFIFLIFLLISISMIGQSNSSSIKYPTIAKLINNNTNSHIYNKSIPILDNNLGGLDSISLRSKHFSSTFNFTSRTRRWIDGQFATKLVFFNVNDLFQSTKPLSEIEKIRGKLIKCKLWDSEFFNYFIYIAKYNGLDMYYQAVAHSNGTASVNSYALPPLAADYRHCIDGGLSGRGTEIFKHVYISNNNNRYVRYNKYGCNCQAYMMYAFDCTRMLDGCDYHLMFESDDPCIQ